MFALKPRKPQKRLKRKKIRRSVKEKELRTTPARVPVYGNTVAGP